MANIYKFNTTHLDTYKGGQGMKSTEIDASSSHDALKKSKWRQFKKNVPLLSMSLPGAIFMIIFSYIPMTAIVLAFQRHRVTGTFFQSVMANEWVGLSNFELLFRMGDAQLIVRNTVLYNIVFITLGIVVPLIFALALYEIHSRFLSKLFQSVLFVPFFLSMMVITNIVFAFLNPNNGMINAMLYRWGFDTINFYIEPRWWPFLLPLVNIWRGVGYNMIIFLAAICGFDKSYYEASMIDGATKMQQITKITIPLLRPIIVILLILAVGGIMSSDFGLFYQVPRGSGLLFPVTQVIDTYIYRGMRNMGDFSVTAAVAFIQSVVGLILVVGTNLLVRKIDRESAMF